MNTLLAIIGALFVTFVILDFVAPARKLTRVRLWRTRGFLAFLLYLAISIAGPMVWDAAIANHMLFDASPLPIWGQICWRFPATRTGRLCLASHDACRRAALAASAPRCITAPNASISGAPSGSTRLDMIGWTLLSSLVLVGGFGISPLRPQSRLACSAHFCRCSSTQISARRAGWATFIACPENHAAHHERGVHAFNYGNISWFDMLFGTFRNPENAPDETGFFDGASNKIGALLIGRKIA